MEKKKTVVQGYTIIERKQAGEVMVVVGHHPAAPAPKEYKDEPSSR